LTQNDHYAESLLFLQRYFLVWLDSFASMLVKK
jgi:hypothetical protein